MSIKGKTTSKRPRYCRHQFWWTNIASTVANINFVGAGNTFAVNGTTVDVSIEGGGGTKAGEAINYPSGTKSPFILNTTVISESITLNDAIHC